MADRCGVPWPVCPDCLGVGLELSAGRARCPSCGREWPAEERDPCPDPAAVELADAEGATGRVCRSHAAHPSAARLARSDRPH